MHGAVVVQGSARQTLDTSLAYEQDPVARAQRRVLIGQQLVAAAGQQRPARGYRRDARKLPIATTGCTAGRCD
jgi:hypothetical protein